MTPADLWRLLAAGILALGLLLHALFPRYEMLPMGEGVVVFDRWTGAFQRATYVDGQPETSQVVRPF